MTLLPVETEGDDITTCRDKRRVRGGKERVRSCTRFMVRRIICIEIDHGVIFINIRIAPA